MILKDKIRVLIAANSSASRLMLKTMLDNDAAIEILDVADGTTDVLIKTRSMNPEVVVLDTNEASEHQVSIIRNMADNMGIRLITLDRKGSINPARPERLEFELLEKIKRTGSVLASTEPGLDLFPFRQDADRPRIGYTPASCLVVIGASTGGVSAIEYILGNISPDFSGAILIAQHMPPAFTPTFTRRLQQISSLQVIEGQTGTKVEKGKVIVASGRANMFIHKVMGVKHNLSIGYEDIEKEENIYDKPSVDLLMHSAAHVYEEKTLGIILSGMGRDGSEGARSIKRFNGKVIVQNEETSVVFGMAKAALNEGHVDAVLPLDAIPLQIEQFQAATLELEQ